MIDLVLKKNCC